ncbi:MAG TPA: site-specific integrase [Actinomycetes bacterium]
MSWRKRGRRYLVSWRLDDGSQGGRTVDTADEARDLAAEKRLEMRRGTWRGRQRGRLPFATWADEWWETWAADDRSPTTLATAESRLRLHVRPWFGDRPIERVSPADVRRWQAHLMRNTGPSTVAQCRSLARRIFQFAMDEGAIDANPVAKVPPPKRRADPEEVFAGAKRRALTPEEAGRLLACFPLFWRDHVTALLGTGLRFGELAGLRRRRVHLDRPLPVLEVGPTRYQAGRFGSGFKPRPKSDAGIRPVPLAPLVAEAVRRQLAPGSDPDALVFTGPGGGPGHRGGPGVPKGTRTVLSRHGFRRTHHAAVAKLADPATDLRPTALRVLKALRASGPLTPDQLAAHLAEHGRALRPATVDRALGELHAAGLAAADGDAHAGRWSALPPPRDPLPDAVDLHGAHDFRHTFATWLEDAAIPARVIDEVMGHEASGRTRQQRGSAMGAHYRHTTPEMAARVAAAVQERLTVVLQVAEQTLETSATRSSLRVF